MTIETAKTAEMVATNNRPRRRIGLNGHKGLNKLNTSRMPLLGVTSLFMLHRLSRLNPDYDDYLENKQFSYDTCLI